MLQISDATEVGLLSGTSFAMRDGRNLYDFIFFGPEPATKSDFIELLIDAESAIVAAYGRAA